VSDAKDARTGATQGEIGEQGADDRAYQRQPGSQTLFHRRTDLLCIRHDLRIGGSVTLFGPTQTMA